MADTLIRQKINNYNNKINIMRIICHQSAGHCSRIKNIISLLLILISVATAVLTGVYENTNDIKIPIVIINALMALVVGFQRSFKYEERSANFLKYSQSYNKLSHDIDKQKVIGVFTPEFLNLIISLYDNITDNINESFPSSIVRKIKDEYEEYNSSDLPSILDKYSIQSHNNSFKLRASPMFRLKRNHSNTSSMEDTVSRQ